MPIPGSKVRSRLEENIHAADVVLTQADRDELDTVAPKGVAAGTRYTEGGMKSVNR